MTLRSLFEVSCMLCRSPRKSERTVSGLPQLLISADEQKIDNALKFAAYWEAILGPGRNTLPAT